MNKRVVVSASVTIALALASCGGGSKAPSTAAFSDQVAGICRTINRGIANLDPATSLDSVRKNATDASGLYEDGVNELKKLTIPTSDKQFASDMKDMITSFEDQLDTLDSIAKAAKENDQDTVNTRMGKLTKQAKESNDLADSLNISRCQLDAVFSTDTVPATTIPATTTTKAQVPLTLPIATEPPTTVPPVTFPVNTTPLSGNKQVISSTNLVPLGNYTFADAPSTASSGFETLLDLAPSMAAQSGRISAVDVIGSDGKTMGRIFAFESDTNPLPPGSFDEVTPFITNSTPTSPMTVGTLNGLTWNDPDGTVNFLVGVTNVVLWSFAPTQDLLNSTLQAWGESISQ
ncbi:MAG: hypothetical protein ACXWBO_05595 [Ilumatobacteraceae bacterium]